MNKSISYVVRARFAGAVPIHLEGLAAEGAVYLGKRGQWASLDKALRFRSKAIAEAALHEKWDRLRSVSNKSVILSVVQLPRTVPA